MTCFTCHYFHFLWFGRWKLSLFTTFIFDTPHLLLFSLSITFVCDNFHFLSLLLLITPKLSLHNLSFVFSIRKFTLLCPFGHSCIRMTHEVGHKCHPAICLHLKLKKKKHIKFPRQKRWGISAINATCTWNMFSLL